MGANPQMRGDQQRQERAPHQRRTEHAADEEGHHRQHHEFTRADLDAGRLQFGVEPFAEPTGFGEPATEVRDAVGDPALRAFGGLRHRLPRARR